MGHFTSFRLGPLVLGLGLGLAGACLVPGLSYQGLACSSSQPCPAPYVCQMGTSMSQGSCQPAVTPPPGGAFCREGPLTLCRAPDAGCPTTSPVAVLETDLVVLGPVAWASTREGLIAAFTQGGASATHLYAQRLGFDLTDAGPAMDLSPSGVDPIWGAPAVAVIGADAIVAWGDRGVATSTVYLARIPAGSQTPELLCSVVTDHNFVGPQVAVAGDGSVLLMTWNSAGGHIPAVVMAPSPTPDGGCPTRKISRPLVLEPGCDSSHLPASGPTTFWSR